MMTNRKYISGTGLSNIAAVLMIAAEGGVEQRAGRAEGGRRGGGRGIRLDDLRLGA
jgi:hypothetical protein